MEYQIIKKIGTTILIMALTFALMSFAVNQLSNYFWKARLAFSPEEIVCNKNPYFECPKPIWINISMPYVKDSIK